MENKKSETPYADSVIDGTAFKNTPIENEDGTYTWMSKEDADKWSKIKQDHRPGIDGDQFQIILNKGEFAKENILTGLFPDPKIEGCYTLQKRVWYKQIPLWISYYWNNIKRKYAKKKTR